MKAPRYFLLQQNLKKQILSGFYKDGDLLPSENELSNYHKITRSTVRQALDNLVKEGYIIKRKGKGSIVRNKKTSLGLLSVKGFSDVVKGKKYEVRSEILEKPSIVPWPENFFYSVSNIEKQSGCIYLKRLRYVQDDPVMLEYTYLPDLNLPDFCQNPMVNSSLFDTLTKRYHVEILDVEQDLRAVLADNETARYLQIKANAPVLHVLLKFITDQPELKIYSQLLCNTEKYSVGNVPDE